MIAVDPTKFNTVEQTDAIVDEILADVKSSEPIKEDGEVLYPGELELKNIKENKEQGIPVVERSMGICSEDVIIIRKYRIGRNNDSGSTF